MAESLAQFFLENFRAHHSDRAYGQNRGYRMEWYTYGQVLQMAVHFAKELEQRAIAKGDRIMLWGENSAGWVAVFFGCALCGVVVVPMDDAASPDFAARVAQQVDAKLWACSRKHAQEIPRVTMQFILDDLTKEGLSKADSTAADSSRIAVTRNDILQIVFTSGTTAEPKGVVITHGNVLANVAPLEKEIQGYLKYERWVHPVRFLSLLPLSHVFGQFLGMFLPPLLGATVIFQEELKPSEIIGTIRRERVSVLVSVPRVLQSLKQKVERDLEDAGKLENFRRLFRSSEGKHFLHRWWIFRRIRRQFGWKFWAFISGGAALDSETEEFWGRLGYAAIQGYGLTETTSLVSVNHPFKLGKRSIGKVLPGRELKLAEDGEIMIRGGGVAAGYWAGSQESASKAIVSEVTDKDGWYGTGDVGALDEAGNLYFKGRKKEVIVTPAGLNIYPEDLEAALRGQPEVRDCVVVGINRGGNAEPCAVLILRDATTSPQKVVDRANQSLAEFQRMRMWLAWPDKDFPRTSTQKPRGNMIAEFAAREILQGAGKTPANTNPVAEMIARITGKNVAATNPDANLDSDLGLSSLDRVELISALEDRYQLDLGETSFTTARTVADIEKMLRGEVHERAAYHYPQWVLRWPIASIRWLAHYLLMRPAMLLLGQPRIEGCENLRGIQGPLLVVCNHLDDVDVGFVQTALPPRLRFRLATATGGEALEKLRTPPQDRNWFGKIYDRVQWALGVSLLNLFPLPREAGFRQSFAYAGRAVDRGYSILVFPEGRHTTTGKMNPFRTGIGLLANNLNIPVLPMRIHGLFELKQAGKKSAAPGTIRVRIGRPIQFAKDSDPHQIAQELQAAIEAL
jgi:long-chain acyl-CoA synthetase